ncbi:MAG: Gfo/Idh/MocA family oxidoreductase [Phycisphaeraceae bacterium]
MHRVLVIGTGSIGERHVRCLQLTGRAEVGICEPNRAFRERVAETYNIGEAFDNLDASLASQWDSAVVATPAPTHIPLARSLVQAGIAPLIEKPLAVETDGATELLTDLAAGQLSAGVAYVYRAHPALGAMREAVNAGQFGKPLQMVIVAGQNFPTYRPAYAQTYYASHASGGGAVQDALTHLLNAGEWLAGPITTVAADAAHLRLADVEVEDTVHVLARHGAIMASYCLNQHQAPNECSLTLICEEGTARLDLHEHSWRWMDRPDAGWTQGDCRAMKTRDDWFTAQESAWLDTVEGSVPPLCSLEEGLQTLRVNRAVLHSIEARQWVDLPQEIEA